MFYNYAMIPINFKYDDCDRIHIRRVLIEYKTTHQEEKVIYYNDTTLVDVDAYFLDKESSHQYIFDNDGYTLIDCLSEDCLPYLVKGILQNKRKYHSFDVEDAKYQAILFIAKSNEEAIKKFHTREELK